VLRLLESLRGMSRIRSAKSKPALLLDGWQPPTRTFGRFERRPHVGGTTARSSLLDRMRHEHEAHRQMYDVDSGSVSSTWTGKRKISDWLQ